MTPDKIETRILVRLAEGPALPYQIVRDTGVGPYTAAVTLERLEQRGLVFQDQWEWLITPEGVWELPAKRGCPGCIRWRFSPVHRLLRILGVCDGKGSWT